MEGLTYSELIEDGVSIYLYEGRLATIKWLRSGAFMVLGAFNQLQPASYKQAKNFFEQSILPAA